MPAPRAFADLLAVALREDGARPLVTFYDDATGERVELSVTTYANWVAKTAGLARDELDLERGALAFVDLPVHWLAAVWLGAAWTLGLEVTDDAAVADGAGAVVCGPDGVQQYADRAARVPVVALSLRPLGARFAEPLPEGVWDFGATVLAHPDVFTPYDAPAAHDPAWRSADRSLSQAEVLADAAAAGVPRAGGRLLTDVAPVSRRGLVGLVGPLLAGGGTVWVRHVDEAAWPDRVEQERVTDELRTLSR